MIENRASNIDVKRINKINTMRSIFECERISYLSLSNSAGGVIFPSRTDFYKYLSQRNTFELDSTYFKCCNYKLEASAIGASLLQVEKFIQQL